MGKRELPTFNALSPLLQNLYSTLLDDPTLGNDTVISSAALQHMYYLSDKYGLYTHKEELRKDYGHLLFGYMSVLDELGD